MCTPRCGSDEILRSAQDDIGFEFGSLEGDASFLGDVAQFLDDRQN